MDFKNDKKLKNILYNIITKNPEPGPFYDNYNQHLYINNVNLFIKNYIDLLKDPVFLAALAGAFTKGKNKVEDFIIRIVPEIPDSYKPLLAEIFKKNMTKTQTDEFLESITDKEIWITCGEIFDHPDDIIVARKKIKELEDELAALKLHVEFMPGGPGYEAAKINFENLNNI